MMSRLPDLLPQSKKFHSAQDAIAALLHTAMIELGFRLTTVNTLETQILNNVLPEGWAQKGPRSYKFWYKHKQIKPELLLRVKRDGKGTTSLFASATVIQVRRFLRIHCGRSLIGIMQAHKTSHVFSNHEFLSPSSFPYDGRLTDLFVSSDQIQVPISKFKLRIESIISCALAEAPILRNLEEDPLQFPLSIYDKNHISF